jgi:hypothetical protein
VVIESTPGGVILCDVPTAISRFGPPLALMALIFFLSAQPDLGTDLGTLDLVLRKGAHMVEFGLLALLWWRALGRPAPAAAIAVLYAVSDEWHQSFVEGRNGSPVDVLIDTTGVALALGAALWLRASRARSR